MIEGSLIYLSAVLYLICLVIFFRRSVLRGTTFTPFVIANTFLLVIVAPSFFASYFEGVSDSAFPALVFMTAFIFMAMGYLSGVRIRFKPNVVTGIISGRSSMRFEKLHGLGVFLLVGLLVCIGLYYYQGLPLTVRSLSSLVTGGEGVERELRMQRLLLTKGAYFGEEYKGQGLITTTMRIGWSLVLAYYVALLTLRPSFKSVLLLVGATAMAWIFVAGTGTRAPFLEVMFAGLVAYSILRPILLRRLPIFIFGFLILGVFLGSYSHKMSYVFDDDNSGFTAAFGDVYERFVFGNGMSDVRAIELSRSGELESYVGQFHIQRFVSSLPGVQGGMPLAYYTAAVSGGGRTTFQTGTYLSTAYVDFGLIGVAVGFSIIGMILSVLQQSLFPVYSSPWAIAISATISANVTALLKGGIPTLLAFFAVFAVLLAIHTLCVVLSSGWTRRPAATRINMAGE